LPANLLLFAAILNGGGHAGSALKALRSHARPEAKKRNQQGRAASVTGSDGIDSVKLGLLTAMVLSHHQAINALVSLIPCQNPLRRGLCDSVRRRRHETRPLGCVRREGFRRPISWLAQRSIDISEA
jgi:hypothetical protein